MSVTLRGTSIPSTIPCHTNSRKGWKELRGASSALSFFPGIEHQESLKRFIFEAYQTIILIFGSQTSITSCPKSVSQVLNPRFKTDDFVNFVFSIASS